MSRLQLVVQEWTRHGSVEEESSFSIPSLESAVVSSGGYRQNVDSRSQCSMQSKLHGALEQCIAWSIGTPGKSVCMAQKVTAPCKILYPTNTIWSGTGCAMQKYAWSRNLHGAKIFAWSTKTGLYSCIILCSMQF